MKHLFYLSVFLLLISCGAPSGKEDKAARTEKVGKAETTRTEVKKYSFKVAGKELTEAKIPYGASVVAILEGLEGFKNVNGKVNCDASIEVFNSKNESIALLGNLFDEEYAGGMPVEKFAGRVELTLTCQTPLKMNETYKIVFKLKDKASEAVLSVSDNFTMTPAQGLSYMEKGLTSDGFFIYKNSIPGALTENTLSPGDTLYGYCSGLTGLAEDNAMVRPDASIALYTEKGESLAEFKDLYKEYEKDGVEAKTVSELITLQFYTPPTLQPKTKYYVLFYIGDKKGKGSLTARYDFVTR